MTGTAIHRDQDIRICGAKTNVKGQNNVYVNNKLASVKGDTNTHQKGELNASNNDGTVFINNIPVVLLNSTAKKDILCDVVGPPHCNPYASSASDNVFACGGGAVEPIGTEITYTSSESGGSYRSDRTGGRDISSGQNSQSPISANAGGASKVEPNYAGINELENDVEFQKKLEEMKIKYPGLTEEELYSIIQGESSFNTKAYNSSSGATGLFQFIPSTLTRINNIYGTSYTTEQLQQMSPAEQLEVYDKYLQSYNYNGTNGLGVMQAAPAYRNKPSNYEVYPVNSRAWKQNPGWRGPDGKITVKSINDYYNRFRK